MITQDALKELYTYNSETGVFTNRSSGNTASSAVNAKGYKRIAIKGKRYTQHRLAWLYVYGIFPESQIDHRDRDKGNNAIDNLRDISNQMNHKNMPMQSNNTSGYTGVTFDKKQGKWCSQITVDGKCVHLGSSYTIEESIFLRKWAETEYGFDPTQGKKDTTSNL